MTRQSHTADVGRSGADAPSGCRPPDGAASVSTADAASIPNAGFTPGPWRMVAATHATGFIRQILPPYAKSAIARVCGDPRPTDVNEANARLIAAAPEMFRALEAIERIAGGMASDNGLAMYDIARQARAKALGHD